MTSSAAVRRQEDIEVMKRLKARNVRFVDTKRFDEVREVSSPIRIEGIGPPGSGVQEQAESFDGGAMSFRGR